MITRMTPMATPQRTNFRGYAKNNGEQYMTDIQKATSRANDEKWKQIKAKKTENTKQLRAQMEAAEKALSKHLGGVATHKLHFPYV